MENHSGRGGWRNYRSKFVRTSILSGGFREPTPGGLDFSSLAPVFWDAAIFRNYGVISWGDHKDSSASLGAAAFDRRAVQDSGNVQQRTGGGIRSIVAARETVQDVKSPHSAPIR
jgi:hypothetical protein